jgi:hypothetical protein
MVTIKSKESDIMMAVHSMPSGRVQSQQFLQLLATALAVDQMSFSSLAGERGEGILKPGAVETA